MTTLALSWAQSLPQRAKPRGCALAVKVKFAGSSSLVANSVYIVIGIILDDCYRRNQKKETIGTASDDVDALIRCLSGLVRGVTNDFGARQLFTKK